MFKMTQMFSVSGQWYYKTPSWGFVAIDTSVAYFTMMKEGMENFIYDN